MKRQWSVWILVVSLIGMVNAIYLTYLKLFSSPFCIGTGCNQVLASPYSTVFSIPISVIGIMAFVGIAAMALKQMCRDKNLSAGIFAVSGVGCLVHLYLICIQWFVLSEWCLFCLLSALIMAIILGITLYGITDKTRLLQYSFYTENPVWCTLGVAFGSVALVFLTLVYYGVVPFNSGTSPHAVVATFDSETVTQNELDRKLGTQLTQLNRRIYDQQYQMLESMLLDYDAKKQGVTTAQLTKKIKRTSPPITNADVTAFFTQNQDKMNGKSFEEMKPRIRRYLEGKSSAEAIGEYVSFLKKKYTFRQFLPRLFNVTVIPNPHQKMTVGPDNAKLKVVIFSDFECPYCKRAHDELKSLYNQYPEDIQLTFRHLPLPSHSGSYMKAVAAVCADAQGKAMAYTDLVFGNLDPQSNEKLVNYARKINLNIPEFEYCLNGEASKQVIQADMDEVDRLSINGTPALFFNGEFHGMVPNGPKLDQLLNDYGIIK